jgi:hypothetical protein
MVDKSRFMKSATGTVDVAKEQLPASPPIGESDLDDPFSAWDDDDAGARKPTHPSQVTSSTTAKTRIGKKLAAAAAAAEPPPVDAPPPSSALAAGTSTRTAPGGMVPSRSPSGSAPVPNVPRPASARPGERAAFPATEPITQPAVKLFDPVSMSDIVLSRTRTIDDPLTTRLLAEISRTDMTRDREAARARPGLSLLPTAGGIERAREGAVHELAELIVTDPEAPPPVDDRPLGSDDELRARRRTPHRMMGLPKDEPFRKK